MPRNARSVPSEGVFAIPSEPTILAIETASATCSVAVRRHGIVPAHASTAMTRGHAEALMPMIIQVLDQAGLDVAAIDLFAVGVGPGGFTGVRVGLAAARGMALAAGRPCAGIGTLEAIAEAVPIEHRGNRPLLVAMDTRRGDLYVQMFGTAQPDGGTPKALPAAALAEILPQGPITVAGDAADDAASSLRKAGRTVRLVAGIEHAGAVNVAAVAARRWLGGARFPAKPAPVYLRPPQATPAPPSCRQR